MLKSSLIGGALAALVLFCAPLVNVPVLVTSAQAQQQVSFNIFFDQLAPNGVWVKSDSYDYVWCPSVDANWSPYTRGHWIYLTDRGWYFDSDEPFAWAVYHYGRWYRDTTVGWCWVPGDTWAPAWVSWRRSNDYVGWAPLEPEGQGYAVGTTITRAEAPQEDWVFVPPRQFLAPQLSTTIILAAQQPDVYRGTQDAGPVVVHNNVVINNVIDVQFIEQQTGTKVPQVKVQTTTRPQTTSQVTNQTIQVFNPTLQKPAGNEAPKQAVAPTQAKQKLSTMTPGGSESGQPTTAGTNAGQHSAGDNSAPTPPGNGAGSATSGGNKPTGANTSNSASSGGKAVSCPQDETLVNGKCRPTKPGDRGKADNNSAASTSGANANFTTNGQSNDAQPANGKGATQSGNGKSAGASPTNKGAGAAGSTGTTCAPNEVLNDGKCTPKDRIAGTHGSPSANNSNPASGGAATTSGVGRSPANASSNAAGTQSGQTATGGNAGKSVSPKTSAKPGAKCPAGEELVQGVCRTTSNSNQATKQP